MTDQDKLIKLAEYFGWTNIKVKPLCRNHPNDRYMWPHGDPPKDGEYRSCEIPDWFEDLTEVINLCYKLNVDKNTKFIEELVYIYLDCVSFDFSRNPYMLSELVSAPARVRAEALGKSLNLW